MATSRIVGDDLSRFWSHVNKSPSCWEWTSTRSPGGYGHITISGKYVAAHRMSFELANGPIDPGVEIDHRCRNRACVNPRHLRPATRKQNVENHSGPDRNNKSGARGVYWSPQHKKWRAQVRHNGRSFFVGLFSSVPEADKAVKAKRNELHTYNDLDRIPA